MTIIFHPVWHVRNPSAPRLFYCGATSSIWATCDGRWGCGNKAHAFRLSDKIRQREYQTRRPRCSRWKERPAVGWT